ncbi:MAG TPA: hypothetical protein VFM37_10305 [Pseudonocardiaceae bacterium]|nr:hypothetical protein [Pseudonocardiaceae bacterium]
MSADPTRSVVVFRLGAVGETAAAEAPTVADDCVRQAWDAVRRERAAEASDVTAVYSEWEPSAADIRFLVETFPSASLSYTFTRPDEDGWPGAFEEARRAMDRARAETTHPPAAARVTAEGELLPILWSPADVLEAMPHQTLVADRLHLALAWVAPTPHGAVGMDHLTHHTHRELGDPPIGDLIELALENLCRGLHIDGEESRHGVLVTLQRPGSVAAGAIALPDFHQRMSQHVGDDRLLVGLPCQGHVLVTAAGSVLAGHVLEAVATAPPATELAPTALIYDPTGMSPVTN